MKCTAIPSTTDTFWFLQNVQNNTMRLDAGIRRHLNQLTCYPNYKRLLLILLVARGEFRPRQTRQLPRAVDLKGRLLSCQSY